MELTILIYQKKCYSFLPDSFPPGLFIRESTIVILIIFLFSFSLVSLGFLSIVGLPSWCCFNFALSILLNFHPLPTTTPMLKPLWAFLKKCYSCNKK